jgi:Uma2 family endonuclease
MATLDTLLTAEEFLNLPNDGRQKELVLGRIVEMTPPATRHGQVCMRIIRNLDRYLETHDVGQLVCNDAGFVTRRNPDSVRGPDISFYGYDQMPKGPMPAHYTAICPRLAVEVLSPSDRWNEVAEKVNEYLLAGVHTVCVFDPESASVRVFNATNSTMELRRDEVLRLPDVFGDEFAVPVNKFFA